MARWTKDSIPDQTGRIIVVTGATSGLGRRCAETLAAKGAEVILAVRDTVRGEAAASEIRARHARARVGVSALDLASLASIAAFARRLDETSPRIDVLLNNAGGTQATRRLTQDGFEVQFGVNHLGHFALTGQLIPALLRAPAPRVVTVSSVAHRRGRMAWDDLQSERSFKARTAYAQSKLANLLFAQELAARAAAQHSRLSSIAAHPGVAATNFIASSGFAAPVRAAFDLAIGIVGHSAEAGSWPSLAAATLPEAGNGEYWGPDGFQELRGRPGRARIYPHALDRADWQRLWTVSEQLTGVTFPPLTD